MKKLLSIGNCPYCDSEQGKYGGWAGSDEMFAEYKKQHEAGHPEFERKHMTIQQEEQWEKEFGIQFWGLQEESWYKDLISFIRSQRKQVKEEAIEIIKNNMQSKEETELAHKIGMDTNATLRGIINVIENTFKKI